MVTKKSIERVLVPQTVKNSVKLVSKTLNEGLSLYSYPISVSQTKDIPKEIHVWLDSFIRSNPVLEVFGSLGMKSYAPHARKPGDLDAVVAYPEFVAQIVVSKLKKHGYNACASPHPWSGGWQVKIKTNISEVVVADLHSKQGHAVRYAGYGFSKKPSKVNGILIQEAEDQLLRKANSIMHKEGVGSHRIAKDLEDFVVIANTMLDSKELRANAKLAKVQQAKTELAKVLAYAKRIEGTDLARMKKDPIPASVERKVIKYAVNNPEVDVRDIVKLPDKIAHTSRVPKRNPPKDALRYPHVDGGADQKKSVKHHNKDYLESKTRLFTWHIDSTTKQKKQFKRQNQEYWNNASRLFTWKI